MIIAKLVKDEAVHEEMWATDMFWCHDNVHTP